MCRHLVLTAYSKASSTIFSFLLFASANRRVAVETTEELWPELLSGVFWRPTAHCAPVTVTQVEDVLACCSPWGRRVRDDWATKRNCSKLRWSSCSYRTCPQASSSSSYPAVVTGASRALGKVSFLAEWNVPGLASQYFCPLKFQTLFAGTFPTEGSQVPRRMHWQEGGLSWELSPKGPWGQRPDHHPLGASGTLVPKSTGLRGSSTKCT